jgi:deoxyribose-phosphate aldolase
LKVILETGLLTEEQIIQACEVLNDLEVDFAKTSTGFNGGGATVEAVSLMRKHLKPEVKIKASGGIRTKDDAERMIAAGADRIGASKSIDLI